MLNDHQILVGHTTAIVAAQIGRMGIDAGDVPTLIRNTFDALSRLGQPDTPPPAPLTPAVPISKSVKPDHIVCLEDGKKLKMLKRHIMTQYNLTPDEYRAKWGLPADYPMTAPNYAEKRRELAKAIGLGTKPKR